MKRIKVDIPAIKEYLRENGMTQVDVCRRIGRGPSFLCSCTEDMAEYTYHLLIQVLGVEDGAFQKKEKAAPQEVNRGVSCIRWGLMFPRKELFFGCIFRARRYARRLPKLKVHES